MKNYEITYLIPSSLSDGEQKGIMERVSSLIQERGGVLKEDGVPVKMTLPQQIDRHREILSVSISFYANPEKIQEMKTALKPETLILRSMIVIKEAPQAPKPIRRRAKEDAKKKVELKDIEEKIEEILK